MTSSEGVCVDCGESRHRKCFSDVHTAHDALRGRLAIMSVASKRALEYLEGQPGIIFNRLYKQPSTALAIFRRMLPHLGEL
jgi:hypothetical protein